MFDVTTQAHPTGVRGRIGRAAHHLIPDLDQRVYARSRARDRKERGRTTPHRDVYTTVDRRQWTWDGQAPVVAIVPPEGPSSGTWGAAQWNIYYEASQRLRETPGDHVVYDFFVEPGEESWLWQRRLVDFIHDNQVTHLLTHIERDPEASDGAWTWDSFWEAINRRWSGVLLGGMFDSSYRFTEAKAKILSRMSPNFLLVDICMPMDGALHGRRREVGPVNIPMSEETLRLVDEAIGNQEKEVDISFMGVMYDYRVRLVEELEAAGVSVAVNPHRTDAAQGADATRLNQPSWLNYMKGLASSRATINFSRSNAGPFEQLKTRVIEVGLAGTYLLTDDRDRTRRFWDEGSFSVFEEPADLLVTSQRLLAVPDDLARATTEFHDRARYLARNHYWGAIEATLRARNLPNIGIDAFSD